MPAIRVENLGKQYLLGEFERYSTFRETIARAVTRPALRLAHRLRTALRPAPRSPLPAPGSPLPAPCSPPEFIWALRDVSFEVQHGEVLGIIGPNGAGKSTLLKILSRITEPTTGYAEIHGRVGSLLEVGTGFHPELTGRENVYLNGAILGMSRAEIRRKFDDIVSFAGVEKFIDTPVKRYSSGMQVRLAFAVAAHLDPEILIIDEVLAVGDAEFQKRCLGKMDEVSRSGRTILFVSHNMAAVQSLCNRGILLREGVLQADRPVADVVNQYISEDEQQAAPGGHTVRGSFFRIEDLVFRPVGSARIIPRCRLVISVRVRFDRPCTSPYAHIVIRTPDGQPIFGFGSDDLAQRQFFPDSRFFSFEFDIARLPLMPGRYSVILRICARDQRLADTLDLGALLAVDHHAVYGVADLKPHWHGIVPVDVEAAVLTR